MGRRSAECRVQESVLVLGLLECSVIGRAGRESVMNEL